MPVIQITGGKLPRETRSTLIRELTRTASEITHVPEEFFTVTILELDDDNLGLGGKTVSEIKAEKSAENR